jgi:hypothetical protein
VTVDEQTLLQILVGLAVSYLLQRLKAASWFPWLTELSTRWVKIAVSAVIAACSALAISVAWDGAAGILTISGLTFANVSAGAQAFLVSFLSQHFSYEMLMRPSGAATKKPKSLDPTFIIR